MGWPIRLRIVSSAYAKIYVGLERITAFAMQNVSFILD